MNKEERIIPFSRGTEYMFWQTANCDNCEKYENESVEPEQAGCKLAYYIDLASVTDGTIPKWVADRVGFTEKKNYV